MGEGVKGSSDGNVGIFPPGMTEHLASFREFLPQLNEESDRGVALIATSFIDEQLRRTIEAFLIEGDATASLLQGFNAPLGSFSTRIAAAAAMGLISDKERQEIDRLRRIRNDFAHEVHVSFADGRMRDRCSNLEFAAKDYDGVIVDSRGRFTTSAVAIILNLTKRPHYVAEQRLKSVEWRY